MADLEKNFESFKLEIYKRFENFEKSEYKLEMRSLEVGREISAENDEIEIQEVNKTLFRKLLFVSFYIKIKKNG